MRYSVSWYLSAVLGRFCGYIYMSKRYGIVYMGSKEKILSLMDYVFQREYEKKYMIDLFCGGLSVSNYALYKTNFQVIANDLNKYVIALHKELLENGGKDIEIFKYDWVSRELFIEVRDNPEKYVPWYVGYVLNVWSFGCNQKDYLYAKDLEENKRTLHEAIVNEDFTLLANNKLFEGFIEFYKGSQPVYMYYRTAGKHKRVYFMEHFKRFITTITDEERHKELQRLEQLEHLNQMEHLSAVIKSASLEERIQFHAKDWKELYNELPVALLENSFIYCDPPYENTKKYQVGADLDYDDFWQWFRECPYPVYVSSYAAPDDIKPVTFDLKLQLLDNGHRGDNKPKKKVQENIYWNGKGNPALTMEDMLFNVED